MIWKRTLSEREIRDVYKSQKNTRPAPLVAADIVETVAIEPSFTNIGVLALIVAVRTFLGWSLEVELEGRWPWNKREKLTE